MKNSASINKNRRRSSIFKPNDTAPVMQNLDYPPDYKEKLITETSEWRQVIKDTFQEMRDCKKLYPSNIIKKVDKSILSKDQLEFLQDTINYDDYLYQVQKISNKAKVVIASHNDTKEALELHKTLIGYKIKKVDEILLMKMNERPT